MTIQFLRVERFQSVHSCEQMFYWLWPRMFICRSRRGFIFYSHLENGELYEEHCFSYPETIESLGHISQ